MYFQILTANHLTRGDVIYWTGHNWSGNPAKAYLFDTDEQARAALAAADDVAIGAYLVLAKSTHGKPCPLHFREVFRGLGPSNYPHGKYYETRHV
jgi:hypothetical protein